MEKKLRVTALILLVMTLFWVILTVISMSGIDPLWKDADFVKWVSDPDIFRTMNYVNVTLLTIGIVVFFSFLYNYFAEYKDHAIVGFVFIPIYGMINLFCYSSQISLVPEIARSAITSQDDMLFAAAIVHANSHSMVGFLNGLAYALLGIPSIVFGVLLYRRMKKISGIILLLSGIMCIVGFTGYLTDSKMLSLGIMIGGILFLLSLISMVFEFKKKAE